MFLQISLQRLNAKMEEMLELCGADSIEFAEGITKFRLKVLFYVHATAAL